MTADAPLRRICGGSERKADGYAGGPAGNSVNRKSLEGTGAGARVQAGAWKVRPRCSLNCCVAFRSRASRPMLRRNPSGVT